MTSLQLFNPADAGISVPGNLPPEVVDALYVHIPFCTHKCHYCDFYSITRQTAGRMHRYVDLVLQEAALWAAAGADVRPRTVFFGGGTPTLLPAEEMHRLLQGLRSRIDFSDVLEWTIEANPATIDLDYCQMLRSAGVDRLSFGAQSFDRSELKVLERHHDPDDVPRSVEQARVAGFKRLNIDLIYAIPGQTLSQWLKSLDTAVDLKLAHLSCYGLTYEPNTTIAVRRRLGQIVSLPESLEIEMFHATRQRLESAGIPPYEVSNFAQPGQECLHNLHYWNGGNYLALGPSAASHIGGLRFRNRPHLGEWESTISEGRLPAIDQERLSPMARAGELIMLQLRLPRGVRFDELQKRYGVNGETHFATELEMLRRQNLIEVDHSGFRLLPAGWILADAIAGQFVQASSDN